jgi:cytochrome P450
MRDYLGPALDTTIFATGHLIHRLATTPGAWDRLRDTPALVPGAINEAVRLDSPIRSFTRLAPRGATIGGQAVPAGARLLVLYGSANRDERVWEAPERYDPGRRLGAQMGFGHGIHRCAGAQLARLEMRALLEAMLPRVAAIETGPPEPALNNLLNGFRALPARFRPA